TGHETALEEGLNVTLTPGSTMPPVLVAGNGTKARRRAAAYGDSWVSLGLSPEDVSAGVTELGQLASQHDRPTPTAMIVAPTVDKDPKKAASQLAAYAAVGTERAILAPTGPDWRRDYEFAAKVRAAL